MDTLFGLQPTEDSLRWRMPIVPEVCVARVGEDPFLFGGSGLGAAITALEAATGQTLAWATAQYISGAAPPSVLELDIDLLAAGRSNTQAQVTAHVGGRRILNINAALGVRRPNTPRQWVAMPEAPPPEDCPFNSQWHDQASNLIGRMEVRDALLAPQEGRLTVWARPREGLPIDAGLLAIVADIAPCVFRPAMGQPVSVSSLDNTLRLRRLVSTDWVLGEARVTGFDGGFAHVEMLIFAQDGELMASASQSVVMRGKMLQDPPPGH